MKDRKGKECMCMKIVKLRPEKCTRGDYQGQKKRENNVQFLENKFNKLTFREE